MAAICAFLWYGSGNMKNLRRSLAAPYMSATCFMIGNAAFESGQARSRYTLIWIGAPWDPPLYTNPRGFAGIGICASLA